MHVHFMKKKKNNMQFRFENIGYLKKGSIELGDLTIIGGLNNTGKTYLNYSIYGFFHILPRLITQESKITLRKKVIDELWTGKVISVDLVELFSFINDHDFWDDISIRFSSRLPDLFKVKESFFHDSKFSVKIGNNHSVDDLFRSIKSVDIPQRTISITNSFQLIMQKKKGTTLAQITIEGKTPGVSVPGALKTILTNSLYRFLLAELYTKKPFIITSERTGVSLFHKELDITRNILFDELASKKNLDGFNPFEFIEKSARYALPINDNINYIRDFESHSKRDSKLWKKEECRASIKALWNSLIQGEFKVENGGYSYHSEEMSESIPLYHSSSSIKSLFAFDLYLRHIAGTNDMLFIDEPELNLHPRFQVGIARILARLVNQGVSILITTHSDYIINELSNLIMLSGLKKSDQEYLLGKHKYNKCELLQPKRVKCYQTTDNTIKECSVDKNGIMIDEIDNTISSLNERYLDIHSYTSK